MHIQPPTKAECIKALPGVKQRYEHFHAVTYADDALDAAVEFAERSVSADPFLQRPSACLTRLART